MTSTPLHYQTLLDVSELLRTKQISPVELTQAVLDRIAATEPKYRSYVRVLPERALEKARAAEAEIARGFRRGPLHGVPIAVKDLCFTSYAPTTGGMAIHADFTPSYDATVVARLEQAGAIILGKLKMTEGAYASHHPSVAPPLNPWGADRWVGSSSSGSGTATATGQCFGSLGSDTGGSIRFPSACCGLTGLKPTWGRVSRYGVFALAESLDHIGPMTRTAADAAAILGAIAGADPNDPTSVPDPVPDYLAGLGGKLTDLVVGFDESYAKGKAAAEIGTVLDAAKAALTELGATFRAIRFPSPERAVDGWVTFCGVETAIAHRDTYPSRAAEYGPVLAGLIDHGRATSGLELGEVLLQRQNFCGELARVFEEVDLLLVPAMNVVPPTLDDFGRLVAEPDGVTDLIWYTAPVDLSRHPTITLLGGFSSGGLPVAFQLVGRHMSEGTLLRAGAAFQRVTDWHTHHPSDN